jgi:hypothetical protein
MCDPVFIAAVVGMNQVSRANKAKKQAVKQAEAANEKREEVARETKAGVDKQARASSVEAYSARKEEYATRRGVMSNAFTKNVSSMFSPRSFFG